MKGVGCVVDISQVFPLPLSGSLSGCTSSDYKFMKPFDPLSSKLGRRSPIVPRVRLAASSSSTTASDNDCNSSSSSSSSCELRVCVNRACRRQGSMETLKTLSGIAPPHVSVKSCGCLGRCGAGPNLVLLPQATYISHCGTPARAAHIMFDLCGGDSDSWTNSLAALALRNKAEDLLSNPSNVNNNDASSAAELLLSQAINLKPFGGIHVLYKDRSSARLLMGNMAEALEDAKNALTLAPKYAEVSRNVISYFNALLRSWKFHCRSSTYPLFSNLSLRIGALPAGKALLPFLVNTIEIYKPVWALA